MKLYFVIKCSECWKRKNPHECPMCFSEPNNDGSDHYTIDYTVDDGFCNYGESKPREMNGCELK